MPIRFRCTTCRRLLGIARRKAGTIVKCPDCGTDLIVPTEVTARLPARAGRDRSPVPPPRPKAAPTPQPANGRGPGKSDSMPLFERPDFESLLNPAVKQATAPATEEPPRPVPVEARELPKPVALPKPAPVPKPVSADDVDVYDVEPVGLVISKGNLTVAAVVVVVLIGLSFAAGYLLAAARLPAASG